MAKKGNKQVAREMLAKLKAEAISSLGELGVTFRQKLMALDGARSNWKINTKNVTGLVCGDAL